jgi:hypothetical protein
VLHSTLEGRRCHAKALCQGHAELGADDLDHRKVVDLGCYVCFFMVNGIVHDGVIQRHAG